jgi:hypothetical protein
MPAWSGNGLITSKADIQAAVDRANRIALQRGNLALVPQPVTTATEAVPDTTGLLPCDPQLAPLLPWRGLKRGVTITATGSTSLLLMLLADAMRNTDSWAAVVGMPEMGWVAAAELGLAMDRVATIPDPGPDWPTIVAALLDGADLVVAATPVGPAASIAKSLAARARQKGSVLITTGQWPGADLALTATERRWHGLRTDGRGRLRGCELDVTAAGRGKAVRPKTATLTLHQPRRPERHIPARATVTALPGTANGMWANGQPSPAPTDPWAGLRAVPHQ